MTTLLNRSVAVAMGGPVFQGGRERLDGAKTPQEQELLGVNLQAIYKSTRDNHRETRLRHVAPLHRVMQVARG